MNVVSFSSMVDAEEHGLDENETTFMEVSHG